MNAAFSWALLAWFVILAIAETRLQSRGLSGSQSDARLVTNFGLGTIGIAASGLMPLANVGSSFAAQQLRTGVLLNPHDSWVVSFSVTLVGLSLIAYWTHRAMHAVPLFWRVHRVHHADEAVDVSTSLRHHPLELLLAVPADALVILLIGAPVSAVVASESFLLAATLLGHADICLPARLDRMLALVLVTPRLHRVHHHPKRRLHDSNYGDAFTVWDRIFGTFMDLGERLPVGLQRQPARPDHFVDQIFSPLH